MPLCLSLAKSSIKRPRLFWQGNIALAGFVFFMQNNSGLDLIYTQLKYTTGQLITAILHFSIIGLSIRKRKYPGRVTVSSFEKESLGTGKIIFLLSQVLNGINGLPKNFKVQEYKLHLTMNKVHVPTYYEIEVNKCKK